MKPVAALLIDYMAEAGDSNPRSLARRSLSSSASTRSGVLPDSLTCRFSDDCNTRDQPNADELRPPVPRRVRRVSIVEIGIRLAVAPQCCPHLPSDGTSALWLVKHLLTGSATAGVLAKPLDGLSGGFF